MRRTFMVQSSLLLLQISQMTLLQILQSFFSFYSFTSLFRCTPLYQSNSFLERMPVSALLHWIFYFLNDLVISLGHTGGAWTTAPYWAKLKKQILQSPRTYSLRRTIFHMVLRLQLFSSLPYFHRAAQESKSVFTSYVLNEKSIKKLPKKQYCAVPWCTCHFHRTSI